MTKAKQPAASGPEPEEVPPDDPGPLDPSDEPETVAPATRSALDDPSHPLHHLRNC